MALITLEKAAERLNTAPGTLEDWVQRGLLQVEVSASQMPPGAFGLITAAPRLVDETAVAELAESLGWLQLSGENWEESEGD